MRAGLDGPALILYDVGMEITIEINNWENDPAEVESMMKQAQRAIVRGYVAEGESAPLFDREGERSGWVTLR